MMLCANWCYKTHTLPHPKFCNPLGGGEYAGADLGFFLGGVQGAPLRNDVTDAEVNKF